MRSILFALPLLLASALPAQGPIRPFNVRLAMPNVVPIDWEGQPALLMWAFASDRRSNVDIAEFWGHSKSRERIGGQWHTCGLSAMGIRLVGQLAFMTDSRPCTFGQNVYFGYYGEPGGTQIVRLNAAGYYLGKCGLRLEWDRAACFNTSRFDLSFCSNPYMGPVACLPQYDPCNIGHGPSGRGYGPEFVALIFKVELL